MKSSFVLHNDSLFILDELTDEQAGQLFKAIKAYHLRQEYKLDFALNLVFILFKNQFERDNENYIKRCNRNAENGLKGGRPKKANESQKTHSVILKPKKADSDNDSDNDSDIISFEALLQYMNNTFGKSRKVVSNDAKKKYKSLLKQGYTKEQIFNSINNCKNDAFHKENKYKYCTPEYFSRPATIDKYADVSTNESELAPELQYLLNHVAKYGNQ